MAVGRFLNLLLINMVCAASSFTASADTYVLVHGGWGGGWTFQALDRQLSARGHTVYRPTLTGLGERVHLASEQTSLSTHIQDVINTIEFEQLSDIILVGHSYGGMVISGVADSVPARIRRLVYVEGLVPDDGESVLDVHASAAARFDNLRRGDVIWHPAYQPDAAGPQPVPQPWRTVTDKIQLSSAGSQLPGLYVLTVEAGQTASQDAFFPQAQRARKRGWKVVELEGDHNIHRSKPDALLKVLID